MCSGCKPKNKMLKEYRIVRGNIDYVEEQVNKMINEGWELNGELQMVKMDNHVIAVQNVVLWTVVKPSALLPS